MSVLQITVLYQKQTIFTERLQKQQCSKARRCKSYDPAVMLYMAKSISIPSHYFHMWFFHKRFSQKLKSTHLDINVPEFSFTGTEKPKPAPHWCKKKIIKCPAHTFEINWINNDAPDLIAQYQHLTFCCDEHIHTLNNKPKLLLQ